MKNLRRLLAGSLLLALLGCSQERPDPVAPNNFTFTGEAEQLPLEVSQTFEQNWPEGMELPSFNLPAENLSPPAGFDTSYAVFAVGFLWGQLMPVALANISLTDWSGGVKVSGGAEIRIAHPIAFEPDQDVFLPSENPAIVRWESFTSHDFDGVAMIVVIKKDELTDMLPELTFSTEPFSVRFSFDQLVHMSAYYQIDAVNAVAIIARRLPGLPCPSGFIAGEWIRSEESNDYGHFAGKWFDPHGQPKAYLNGRFWTNDDGSRWFRGSYSGLFTDDVLGQVKGQWVYDDPRLCVLCGEALGKFRGIFTDTEGHLRGTIRGKFGDLSLPLTQKNLPFRGEWRVSCDSDDHPRITKDSD